LTGLRPAPCQTAFVQAVSEEGRVHAVSQAVNAVGERRWEACLETAEVMQTLDDSEMLPRQMEEVWRDNICSWARVGNFSGPSGRLSLRPIPNVASYRGLPVILSFQNAEAIGRP